MKARDPKIIEILNDVLSGELTAINQYFLHAKMCANWGYTRLADILKKESIEEMQHADELIDRILYLEGIPNVQRIYKVRVGENVAEQLDCDLALEMDAHPKLVDGIDYMASVGDHGSRLLLEKILAAEEEHIDWIEAQRDLIDQMGIENYLAQQMR